MQIKQMQETYHTKLDATHTNNKNNYTDKISHRSSILSALSDCAHLLKLFLYFVCSTQKSFEKQIQK